ncbi:hypothetical protein SAM46_02610 [Mycoplasmopsis verecunda]|uniref:hypothetical protein n=1 Tax=Mycoplasmopsis verecunda TaxID=171291 RepID=UPI00298C405B|nr:hypothetical protein [Mycoplasmopsis verecunda]WPB54358.1 hypothetical protein SAM46_02610 [Mycoplasmopsis verecunda]
MHIKTLLFFDVASWILISLLGCFFIPDIRWMAIFFVFNPISWIIFLIVIIKYISLKIKYRNFDNKIIQYDNLNEIVRHIWRTKSKNNISTPLAILNSAFYSHFNIEYKSNNKTTRYIFKNQFFTVENNKVFNDFTMINKMNYYQWEYFLDNIYTTKIYKALVRRWLLNNILLILAAALVPFMFFIYYAIGRSAHGIAGTRTKIVSYHLENTFTHTYLISIFIIFIISLGLLFTIDYVFLKNEEILKILTTKYCDTKWKINQIFKWDKKLFRKYNKFIKKNKIQFPFSVYSYDNSHLDNWYEDMKQNLHLYNINDD